MTIMNPDDKPLPFPKKLLGKTLIVIGGRQGFSWSELLEQLSQEPSGQKTTPEEKKD